ncbi:outer membrane protein [Zoogloea oryzae]|uniref:Outer membrane protein n=1 Tax=Zoogloea oryzae TaxID=310767 RepID=A0ABQ6FCL8_9RHOO|nr:OmpW family outer membrane protein [Zoogloea oryzae]GLT23019.1 outer membrane protein [Zoogloea oryzae]
MYKKIAACTVAALAALSAGAVQAQESPWMVRARAVYLSWDNGNADGLQNAGVGTVSADKRWIPEVDISYFFTKNIAAELVLTYPQDVDIKTAALGGIGHVQALPPSLLLQYHFTDLGAFKPYVGLGLNYTIFTKDSFNTALGKVSVDGSSWGLAAQVGMDYAIDKKWSINLDAKYIQMDTDVKLGGTKIGKLDLNPITYGVGIGYRF